jgi:thiol:disulfide interchange protein
MVTLRAILSIPMFLTALALAWVLGRQAGVEGMTAGLAGALLLGLFLWWLGSRQASGNTGWVPAGGAIAAAIAAIALLPIAEPAAANTTSAPAALQAQRFSPERLAELRGTGTPVFLYMTADWCLTCKVNEGAAIEREEVRAAFEKAGVVVLRGDWTRRDAAITRYLTAQGAAGVPLYMWYPAQGEPQQQPQVLSVGTLTGLVK